MNKVSLSQRRTMGRSQPKRPKLDFSTGPTPKCSYSFTQKERGQSEKDVADGASNAETKTSATAPTATDWDEDLPEEMLEKVCLIADLSQSMANVPKVIEISDFSIPKQGCKRTAIERDRPNAASSKVAEEELERLREENERLRESIETKEGEVNILRSQLKQNQEAKQAETLNNIKIMEDMQNAYREKLEAAEKENKSARTELQFKDLELKSMTERCKQLESNSSSKVVLVEPQTVYVDGKRAAAAAAFGPSQPQPRARAEESEKPLSFCYVPPAVHEGRKLSNLLCPEFFKSVPEPSVIPYYTFRSDCNFHVSSLDFDKREKYKWSGLPKQTVFVSHAYDLVTELFLSEGFAASEALLSKILGLAMDILRSQKALLAFLEQLQETNAECNDSDITLLDGEEGVEPIAVKRLLDGEKINAEECGIEARRALALIAALVASSKHVAALVVGNVDLLTLLKDLASSVGCLGRPTRYVGILAGIAFILTPCLRERELGEESLAVLNRIVEEIIFARPKLDVLALLVEMLTAGTAHEAFVTALCRDDTVGSSALYMDSKLHQALFFTKDACPLKLLFVQITGLSCIPANREMKWNITRLVIRWLNAVADSPAGRRVKWLPGSGAPSEGQDKCFDVTEYFVYLLNSCLIDHRHRGPPSPDVTRTLRDGCLLFYRIFKSDPRMMLESSHNLRLATLLKGADVRDGSRGHHDTAVNWIADLLEPSEAKNHDEGCARDENFNGHFETLIDALKIDVEST